MAGSRGNHEAGAINPGVRQQPLADYPEGEVAPVETVRSPSRQPLAEVVARTDREDGVRIEYGRALFEDGYLHGWEGPDVFAPVVNIPSQNGRYRAVGRLETGKRLFRWEDE